MYRPGLLEVSPSEASAFIAASTFPWHQKWEIAPDVFTPGASGIEWLLHRCGLPEKLDGLEVLDVGTNNGGAAFMLESRGACVTAMDIYPPADIGFTQLQTFLRSRATYIQGSIYEPSALKGRTFDLILCLGVLYHLRHPLLALDNLRRLTRGQVFLDTEIEPGDDPRTSFYRERYESDPTTWFVPTLRCASDWCISSGFDIDRTDAWCRTESDSSPSRALLVLRPTKGDPEYAEISYERSLPTGRTALFSRAQLAHLWSRFQRLR